MFSRVRVAIDLASAARFALTVAWPDWIERVSGWDPGQHSG